MSTLSIIRSRPSRPRALATASTIAVVLAIVGTSCSSDKATGDDTKHLVIATQPAGGISGSAFATQPVIELRDASNNLVVSASGSVTASIASGTGTLVGTASAPFVNGVATFTGLGITGSGSFTLAFSATGATGVTSSAVTVLALQLAISTQPGGAASGSPFTTQPVIQIRDANNNVVTSSTASVTASIASGTGTLIGTATVSAVNGVATYTNLGITGSGNFTLSFAAAGIPSVTSGTISIATGPSPIIDISFDGYASTAALLGDCTKWSCVADENTAEISLDPTVAPPGSTKSMRYRYLHPGNGCNSITIKRAFRITPVQQEVWAEFRVRWSSNFTTANSACPPNDHKLIFGDTEASQSGRWAFYVGADSPPNHTLQVERPSATGGSGGGYLNQNPNQELKAQHLWNGEWHTIRLHLKHSTTATSADGAFRVWVNGVLRHDQTGFNTAKPSSEGGGADRLEGFSFAHNKDDGPGGVEMFLWWGPIRVFTSNPGW